ncbi:hypothetical protein H632_c5356p0, partial [Helicosporidium sp. ATCC 50920]
ADPGAARRGQARGRGARGAEEHLGRGGETHRGLVGSRAVQPPQRGRHPQRARRCAARERASAPRGGAQAERGPARSQAFSLRSSETPGGAGGGARGGAGAHAGHASPEPPVHGLRGRRPGPRQLPPSRAIRKQPRRRRPRGHAPRRDEQPGRRAALFHALRRAAGAHGPALRGARLGERRLRPRRALPRLD